MNTDKTYSVYIMAGRTGVIYIGMTGNVWHRILAHKAGVSGSTFSSRYRTTKLVYIESFGDVDDCIRREKFPQRLAAVQKGHPYRGK